MGADVSREITVSVDAMGGDHAPGVVVHGLARCVIRHPEARFLLCGDEARLKPLLAEAPEVAAASEILHADDVIAMDEKPSAALRRGRGSSMWKAVEAVKAGDAQVAVSGGNTGALMAMAKMQLKTVPGIERPAIAAIWPTMRGESIVLDVGANVEPSARQLVEFTILGEAFARAVLGLPKPTVGLLNVGSEELKGHETVRAADRQLKDRDLGIRYVGFVEGDDISAGAADVVVADGFTGNVALKTAEGTARLVGQYLRDALTSSTMAKVGAFLASGALRLLKEKMDPRSVNGGTFLGLNGVVVKSHGGSDAVGYASALDLAVDMAASAFSGEIATTLERLAAEEQKDVAEREADAPSAAERPAEAEPRAAQSS